MKKQKLETVKVNTNTNENFQNLKSKISKKSDSKLRMKKQTTKLGQMEMTQRRQRVHIIILKSSLQKEIANHKKIK